MVQYTDKEQEEYLNEYYSEIFTPEQAAEHFANFDVKPSTIMNACINLKLGTLQRKHDPIAFRMSKEDRSN